MTNASDDQATRALPRLLGDWVLVRIDRVKTITETGILLAERDFEWTEFGTVLAMGNGLRHPKTGERVALDELQVGHRVIFAHRPSNEKAATEQMYGKGAVLMRIGQIDGIVEPENEIIHRAKGAVAYMDGIDPPCTCEAIAHSFDPSVLVDGEHHEDCPRWRCVIKGDATPEQIAKLKEARHVSPEIIFDKGSLS